MMDRTMLGTRTPEGKVIAILLAVILAFMTWNASSIQAFADDGVEPEPAVVEGDGVEPEPAAVEGEGGAELTAQEESEPIAPEQPDVADMSTAEANTAIEAYNAEVDEYNAAAEKVNADRQAAYEADVQAVEEHNAAEDQKVAENQAALKKQANRQAWIDYHSEKGLAQKTTEGEELPNSLAVVQDAGDTKTIFVEAAEVASGITYKAINVHIFLKDGVASWDKDFGTYLIGEEGYVPEHGIGFGTDADGNQIIDFTDSLKSDMLFGEWEAVEVDANDTVTLIGEASLFKPYTEGNAMFFRYMEGYTQGLWLGDSIFASNLVDADCGTNWKNGPVSTFSGKDGTTDNLPIGDVVNLFVYAFYRFYPEPVEVEKYDPSIMDMPSEPTFLNILEHMSLLPVDDDPTPAPVPATEPGSDPDPAPATEPEPEPVPAVEPAPAADPEPEPVPAVEPAPAADPEPAPATDPEPAPVTEPATATVPEAEPATEPAPAAIPAAATPAAAEPAVAVVNIPAAAAPAAPATPVAATTIVDNPTPQAAGEVIDDDANALASGTVGAWSLFDLLCSIASVVLAALMLIGIIGRKRHEGEEEQDEPDQVVKRRRALKAIGVIPAIAAVVLFILTQDLTQPMAMFDGWSIWFAVIAIASIALRIASIRRKADDDNKEQPYAPAAA